ncbi:hypothetical protein ACFL0U_02950 [Pseudomonadota bacterium]
MFSGIKRFILPFVVLQAVMIILVCISIDFARGETIDNIKTEFKTFDEWTVVCDKDVMMEQVRCKVAAKFYNNTASVFVQPENKVANHVVFIIPTALQGSIVKIKVGKNNVIVSNEVGDDDFAVIPMRESFKKKILDQMKNDDTYLYIRFYVRDIKAIDGRREITERISLAKFNEMIDYYYSQVKANQ